MKFLLSAALCFFMQCLCAQSLDLSSLEKILYAPASTVDSALKKSNFRLTEKQKEKGYCNYYYTSYERKDLFKHLLRSLSYMDVFANGDTSRIVLYRTYYETDQQELKKQLIANGYELTSQQNNNFIYKKGDITITNKITEKTVPRGKPMTAYEFELGR